MADHTGHTTTDLHAFSGCCRNLWNALSGMDSSRKAPEASSAIRKLLLMVFETFKEQERTEALSILFDVWKEYSHLIVSNWSRMRPRDYELVFELLSRNESFRWQKKPIRTIAMHLRNLYYGGSESAGVSFFNWLASLKDEEETPCFRLLLITDEEPSEHDRSLEKSIMRCSLPEWGQSHISDEGAEKMASILEEYQIDLFIQNIWFQHRHGVWDMLLVQSAARRPAFVQRIGGSCANILDTDELQEAYYKHPDALIALSHIAEIVWQAYNLRTYLIPNYPTVYQRNSEEYKRNPSVLWMNRLSGFKMPFEFIKVARLVHKKLPHIRFDVVGKADSVKEQRKLQKYVRKLKLQDSLTFHGIQNNPGYYYGKAGVMLLTSRAESYSNVLYEAAAYALPVVMYELPELDYNEQFPGRESVTILDAEGAAAKIIRFFTDDEYYYRVRKAMAADYDRYLDNNIKQIRSTWTKLIKDLEQDTVPDSFSAGPEDIKRLIRIIKNKQLYKQAASASGRAAGLKRRMRSFLSKHFFNKGF